MFHTLCPCGDTFVINSLSPFRVPLELLTAPPSPNMQNMSRRFGRMTTKSSADDSQIAVLLKDFDDADMLLGKVDNVTPMTRVLSDFLIRVILSDRGIYPSLA